MPGRDIIAQIISTQTVSRDAFGTVSLQMGQGVDVVAANDLTLGSDGNTFAVTGTTTINRIDVTGWTVGSAICLAFTEDCIVTHDYFDYASGFFYPMLLSGARDYQATGGTNFGRNGSVLVLRLVAASYFIYWREIARNEPRPNVVYSPLIDPATNQNVFDPTDDVIVGPD